MHIFSSSVVVHITAQLLFSVTLENTTNASFKMQKQLESLFSRKCNGIFLFWTVPNFSPGISFSNPVATGRRTYGTNFVAGSAPPVMGWMQQQQQQTSSSPDSQSRSSGKTKKTKTKNVKVRPAATECSDCHNGCPSQTGKCIVYHLNFYRPQTKFGAS